MTDDERDALRRAFADYMACGGCGCCADVDGEEQAAERMASLLGVPAAAGFKQYTDRAVVVAAWMREAPGG